MAASAPKKANRRQSTIPKLGAGIERQIEGFHHVDWLELKEVSPLKIISAIDVGLPFSRFESLQAVIGLPANQLAAAIKLPASTMARQKKVGHLTSDQSERLVRLARITEMAFDLFEGDADAARRWLKAPRDVLGGNTPLQMVATEIGAREVENLIGRLQDGVFS